MPKITNVVDFRKKVSQYARELNRESNGYLFVANETFRDNSFFVVAPTYLRALAVEAKDEKTVQMIDSMNKLVQEKVSRKYKNIIGKRWKDNV